MHWPFSTSNRALDVKSRDYLRDMKVLESQQALLEAAVATADAANVVTTALKSKLEDSMAQIENTARILNDALVICDLEGKIQAFNPAAERMFEMTADQVRETFIGSLFSSENISSFKRGEEVWQLLANLEAAENDGELKGIKASGEAFPLDVNHTRLDRSDGTSIILLILRNCDAESSKLKNYKSIFDSSFDGILVVENEKIVAANPAATALFGYDTEELLSKSLNMLFTKGSPLISGGEPLGGKQEAKHHDGHLMELYFTTTTICWNSKLASLITIKSVNGTQAEEDDRIEKMVCCFDSSFKITFANSAFAKFYSVPKESLIGRDIRTLMPTEECHPFLINVSRLSPEAPTRRMQLRSTDETGKQRLQFWTDHASYDENDVEYQRIGSGKIRKE